jgi:hypothetical protein
MRDGAEGICAAGPSACVPDTGPSTCIPNTQAALSSTDRPERAVPAPLEPWWLVPPDRYQLPLEPATYN